MKYNVTKVLLNKTNDDNMENNKDFLIADLNTYLNRYGKPVELVYINMYADTYESSESYDEIIRIINMYGTSLLAIRLYFGNKGTKDKSEDWELNLKNAMKELASHKFSNVTRYLVNGEFSLVYIYNNPFANFLLPENFFNDKANDLMNKIEMYTNHPCGYMNYEELEYINKFFPKSYSGLNYIIDKIESKSYDLDLVNTSLVPLLDTLLNISKNRIINK